MIHDFVMIVKVWQVKGEEKGKICFNAIQKSIFD